MQDACTRVELLRAAGRGLAYTCALDHPSVRTCRRPHPLLHPLLGRGKADRLNNRKRGGESALNGRAAGLSYPSSACDRTYGALKSRR